MIKIVKSDIQIKEVVALAKEIWVEHYTKIIGIKQINYMMEKFQSVKAVATQIKNEGYLYYLIEENNSNIGYFAVLLREDELYLSKCYILSSKRGKGYGKEAMNYIVNLCIEKDLKKITLNVNKHNTKSIAAYKKLNYKIIDSVVNDIGNGFVMDDYIMEKKV
jgi:diamine N-acetyltransferase